MIPSCVSWKYNRTDIINPEVHGLACKVEMAVEDIYLTKVLPEDIDNFVLFVFIIGKQNDKNFIISALKTKENLGEEERILKGTYFACYLIPVKLCITSYDLQISDLFNPEFIYQFDIKNIFNENYINTITLPEKTFTF